MIFLTGSPAAPHAAGHVELLHRQDALPTGPLAASESGRTGGGSPLSDELALVLRHGREDGSLAPAGRRGEVDLLAE